MCSTAIQLGGAGTLRVPQHRYNTVGSVMHRSACDSPSINFDTDSRSCCIDVGATCFVAPHTEPLQQHLEQQHSRECTAKFKIPAASYFPSLGSLLASAVMSALPPSKCIQSPANAYKAQGWQSGSYIQSPKTPMSCHGAAAHIEIQIHYGILSSTHACISNHSMFVLAMYTCYSMATIAARSLVVSCWRYPARLTESPRWGLDS